MSLKNLYIKFTSCLITIIIVFVFWEFWIRQFNGMMEHDFLGKGNLMIVLIYLVMTILFFRAFKAYKIGYFKVASIILSQVLALVCINIITMLQIILMVGKVAKLRLIIIQIINMTAIVILVCIVMTFLLNRIYIFLFPPYRMLEIYGEHKNNLRGKMGMRADKYFLETSIHISKPLDEIKQMLTAYDAVLLNDIPSKLKNELLKFCFSNSIRVYFTPKISDVMVKGAVDVDLFDSPLLLCKNDGLTLDQRFLKRAMDILLSVIGLALSAPFILVSAICIKAYDQGPVFFTQRRCSLDGKVFTMYKLRSMVVDAEKEGKSKPATDGDDRITPIGRWIRKTRMDELPQLVNVLKGDMSIVGPRPERIEHVEKYTKAIPEFSYRMKVKGGLTGYAQVYGKYNTSAYDKLKMDLKYIVNYSLLLDIQILFMTVKIIFMKESTEGFQMDTPNNTIHDKKDPTKQS